MKLSGRLKESIEHVGLGSEIENTTIEQQKQNKNVVPLPKQVADGCRLERSWWWGFC